jgi:hypothetical protein
MLVRGRGGSAQVRVIVQHIQKTPEVIMPEMWSV